MIPLMKNKLTKRVKSFFGKGFSKKENHTQKNKLTNIFKNIYNSIVSIGNKTIKTSKTVMRAFSKKNITKIGYFVIILFLYVWDFIKEVFSKLLPFITKDNIVLVFRKSGIFLKKHWSLAGTLVLIIGFVVSTNNVAVALKVTYKGDVIGYVQNQDEVNSLVNKVEDDISYKIGEAYSLILSCSCKKRRIYRR